jgi:hypothetical protein
MSDPGNEPEFVPQHLTSQQILLLYVSSYIGSLVVTGILNFSAIVNSEGFVQSAVNFPIVPSMLFARWWDDNSGWSALVWGYGVYLVLFIAALLARAKFIFPLILFIYVCTLILNIGGCTMLLHSNFKCG